MPLVSIEAELDHTGASQAGETIDNLNVCISGDFRHAAATVHMASEKSPAKKHIKQPAGLPDLRNVILLT
jgi:hypothetical protein